MSNGWLTLLQGAASVISSGKLVELAQTAEEITKVAPTIVSQIEGLLRPIKENRAATGEELAAAVRVLRANDAALKAATETAEKNA